MSQQHAEQDRVGELERQLARLEAQLQALDERNRELENEAAQRGVKLSCANIALARAKIAFDETSRHREEMVQEVAHDLRTPLTSIKGAAQNLLDGMAGDLASDAREYVDIIGEHAERLIGVVNWLVDAMKVSAEPIEVVARDAELGALAERVVRSLRPLAEESGLALSVETGRETTVFMDEDKIRQVLENLIGNALKFTNRGGKVDVLVEGDAETVRVRVRDTGVGMDAEQVERIFDRYYRSDSGAGGSGLGLVISREVVRLHGGDICARSEPGKGSELEVQLPRDGQRLKAWALEGS